MFLCTGPIAIVSARERWGPFSPVTVNRCFSPSLQWFSTMCSADMAGKEMFPQERECLAGLREGTPSGHRDGSVHSTASQTVAPA